MRVEREAPLGDVVPEMGFRPMGFRTRPGNSTLGSRNRHVRPDPDPDSASNLH